MIFFLHGPDAFRGQQTIKEIVQRFKQNVDAGGMNIHQLDSSEFETEAFFNLVKAQGFLASKKLIIIKNIFDTKDFKNVQETITAWLDSQKDTREENYVIFWQNSETDKRTKLFKKLSTFKFVSYYPELTEQQASSWIPEISSTFGCSIAPEAVHLLTALVGTDSWQLYNEVHKLAHLGQKNITEAMVAENVSAKIVEAVFDIVDACTTGDKATAHRLIDTQLRNGLEPLYLFAMITRQFRLAVQALDVVAHARNAYALAESLSIHPFVAKKLLAQVRNLNSKKLPALYELLLKTDQQLKYQPRQTAALFTRLVEKI